MRIIKDTAAELVAHRSNMLPIAVGALLACGGVAGWAVGHTLKHPSWGGPAIAAGVVGLLILAFTRSSTIRIDSGARRLAITTRNLLGTAKTRDYDAGEIKEVFVEERIHSQVHGPGNGSRRERHQFLLTFHFHDGRMDGVDITPSVQTSVFDVSTTRFVQNNRAFDLANRIAQRLGVPCSDRRMPTFGEIAGATGRLIETLRDAKPPGEGR